MTDNTTCRKCGAKKCYCSQAGSVKRSVKDAARRLAKELTHEELTQYRTRFEMLDTNWLDEPPEPDRELGCLVAHTDIASVLHRGRTLKERHPCGLIAYSRIINSTLWIREEDSPGWTPLGNPENWLPPVLYLGNIEFTVAEDVP